MDAWAWEQLQPWLELRRELPVGPLLCVIHGTTRGRHWSSAGARAQLRRTAAAAGVRRRFAPHQLRHADAVELAREGVPLNVIQRQLGHANLGTTSIYAGDDSAVKVLAAGILAAYDGISVEDFEAQADAFLRSANHPTLGRGYLQTAYAPMVELLEYLTANEFTNYIASGGGRDFMRPITQEVYGIPRECVIGSASTFDYSSSGLGGTITHRAEADYLDDGPQKPIRIWSRTG